MNPIPVTEPTTVSAAPPDWASISLDVTCPLCAYNLRGLTDPRCPECGYQFAWPDLLDPKRRAHPYIFEHHPRHNVWSFLRTAVGGLLPWKFWSSLRPDQTSRPRRLVAYWAGTMLLLLILLIPVDCAALSVWITAFDNSHPAWRLSPSTSATSYLDWPNFGYVLRDYGPSFIACWVACLTWPWLTLAILMIFRISMKRAKVKTEHVLRSVLYSADAFLWPALLLAAFLWIQGLAGVLDADGFSIGQCHRLAAWLIAIVCLLPAVKLWAAYQQYLRFPHALATIIASQMILVMTVLAVLTIPAVSTIIRNIVDPQRPYSFTF